MDLAELGEAIRQRRRELGLTQAQLAEQGGLHRTTLIALENGQILELGVNRLLRLLESLGLTLRTAPAATYRPTMDELSAMNESHVLEVREPRRRYRG